MSPRGAPFSCVSDDTPSAVPLVHIRCWTEPFVCWQSPEHKTSVFYLDWGIGAIARTDRTDAYYFYTSASIKSLRRVASIARQAELSDGAPLGFRKESKYLLVTEKSIPKSRSMLFRSNPIRILLLPIVFVPQRTLMLIAVFSPLALLVAILKSIYLSLYFGAIPIFLRAYSHRPP